MRRSINTTLVAVGALGLATLAGACSDSASPEQATVQMQSQLNGSAVTLAKGIALAGAEVDSLRVTKVRMLVTRLKLHRDKADTTGDHVVKTDPFIITFEGGTSTFANASIPPGTYDKVKFEFHTASNEDVAKYLSDPAFAAFTPFATGGRYSVLIDAMLYLNGTEVPYTYKSDAKANLSLNFDTPITLAEGSTTTLIMKVNPVDVFKKGNAVLDPRDAQNESDIDNAIKAAIRLQKK